MDIPLKVSFTRKGDLECMRRITLYNPTLQVVYDKVKDWCRGGFELGYKDDEGDLIAMDTEVEWDECVRLWKEIVANSDNKHTPLRLEAKKVKPSKEHREKKQREAKETVTPPQQKKEGDVVAEVLTFVCGSEEMKEALAAGSVSPYDLGLGSWLKVTPTSDGQLHLDADLVQLGLYLQSSGLRALELNDFPTAVEWFRFATRLTPTASVAYYNLACSHSRNSDHDDALAAFEKSLQLGYTSFSHIVADDDLNPIKELPQFSQIMSTYFGGDYEAMRREKAAAEEAKRLEGEEALKLAKEQVKRAEEEARLQEDALRLVLESRMLAERSRRFEEEARRVAEEEAARVEEEARRVAEEEARRQAEEEVRRVAEEEARRAEEVRRILEEEARAEEEARRLAEEREQAAEEARRLAEEEQARAEEEARLEAERRQVEEEARRVAAEQARAEEDARLEAERLAAEAAVIETQRAFEEQMKAETKVAEVSETLRSMGFPVTGETLELIRKHNFNVEIILAELLSLE